MSQMPVAVRPLVLCCAALLAAACTRVVGGAAVPAFGAGPNLSGVDVDRVVAIAFFLGSALAGAAGLIFGLYYNYTSFIIGYTAGLRAFTAAVLGGIGNIPGAMLGGLIIGLIESLGGQFLAVRWTDVIIFSILVLVLVLPWPFSSFLSGCKN